MEPYYHRQASRRVNRYADRTCEEPVFKSCVQEQKKPVNAPRSHSQRFKRGGGVVPGLQVFKRSIKAVQKSYSKQDLPKLKDAQESVVQPVEVPAPLQDVSVQPSAFQAASKASLPEPDPPATPSGLHRHGSTTSNNGIGRTHSTPDVNVVAYESRTERLFNMHKRLEEGASGQGLAKPSASLDGKRASHIHRLHSTGPSLNSIPSRREVDFSDKALKQKIVSKKSKNKQQRSLVHTVFGCFRKAPADSRDSRKEVPEASEVAEKGHPVLVSANGSPTADADVPAVSAADLLRKSITLLSSNTPRSSIQPSPHATQTLDVHPVLRLGTIPPLSSAGGSVASMLEAKNEAAQSERGLFRDLGKSIQYSKAKLDSPFIGSPSDPAAPSKQDVSEGPEAKKLTVDPREVGSPTTASKSEDQTPASKPVLWSQTSISALTTSMKEKETPAEALSPSSSDEKNTSNGFKQKETPAVSDEEALIYRELKNLGMQTTQTEKASKAALRKWQTSQERQEASANKSEEMTEPRTPRSPSTQSSSPLWSIKAVRHSLLGTFIPAPPSPRQADGKTFFSAHKSVPNTPRSRAVQHKLIAAAEPAVDDVASHRIAVPPESM